MRAAGGEDDTPEEAAARAGMSAARKRSPKPLPSTFGEGKSKGKVKGFEDPFEKSSGSKPPAASPFDMPASALDAATSTKPPDSPASPASIATPSSVATPVSLASPASHVDLAAPPWSPSEAQQPISPTPPSLATRASPQLRSCPLAPAPPP